MVTEVALQHGDRMIRVHLPLSVAALGAGLGVLAAIGTPVAGTPAPTPTPTPTPSAPYLQGLSIQPAVMVDVHGDQVAGQPGRVKGRMIGGGAETIYASLETAISAGATKVSAVYDSVSSTWITFSSAQTGTPLVDLDLTTLNGLPILKDSTGATVYINHPFAAFTGATGYTMLAKVGTTDIAYAGALWVVTGNGVGRYVLNVPTNKTIAPTGRVTTGGTLSTGATAYKTCGQLSGAPLELIGGGVDHETGTLTAYRWGEVAAIDTNPVVGNLYAPASGGPYSALTGAATAANFRIPPNGYFGGLVVFATPPNAAEMTTLGRRLQASCIQALSLGDWQATWWGSESATINGRTLIGGSTYSGAIMMAEVDNATRRLTCVRPLVNGVVDAGLRLSPDDHDEGNVLLSPNGGARINAIGHNTPNSIGSANANACIPSFWIAPGQRLADMTYLGRFTAAQMSGLNYCNAWQRGTQEIGYITIDDPSNGFVPIRNTVDGGATIANDVAGRKLLTQAAAPGGGTGFNSSNQVYGKWVQTDADTFVGFVMPNAANFNTSGTGSCAFRRAVFNLATGNLELNGVVIGNAWANVTAAALADITAAPVIYTWPLNKSCRILDASKNGKVVVFLETDQDGTNAVQKMLMLQEAADPNLEASWLVSTLGAAGACRDPARRYGPSFAFDKRAGLSGFVGYRQFNDGISGAAGKVEKIEFPVTPSAAPALTRNVITGPTAEVMTTIWSPEGAQASLPYYSHQGPSWTTYVESRIRVQLGAPA
jgi:hypothetical protein